MGQQVKTYRVLSDGMKVGDSVRNFGDLMPEAANFENLRSYLNSGVIEETWVDESVLSEWEEERAERESSTALDSEGDKVHSPTETKKTRKVVKKTAAKKKPAKKKGEDNAGKLTEAAV